MNGSPVAVIGMSRSGTSAVSRICGILGYDLGDERTMLELVPSDNARGYWEQSEVVALNEAIFATYGSGWWVDAQPLPADWLSQPSAEEFLDRGRDLLASTFRSSRTWGFKDPRASLTLPFWQELAPDLAAIICVRHPAEVALSLSTRAAELYPVDWTVRTWLRYTSTALRFAAPPRRLVVFYEDLVADPRREVDRIDAFLTGRRRFRSGARERAALTVEPELRHHGEGAHTVDLRPEILTGWELARAGAYDALAELGPALETAIFERDHRIVENERLTAALEARTLTL